MGLVSMYLVTGQTSACRETCKRYMTLYREDYEFPLALALSYVKENDLEHAARYAHAVVEINGSVIEVQKILKMQEN